MTSARTSQTRSRLRDGDAVGDRERRMVRDVGLELRRFRRKGRLPAELARRSRPL